MRLQAGHLLLFKPTALCGRVVCCVTCSKYCHVGLVVRVDGEPSLLEFREFAGFRMTPMVHVTGRGDVYEVRLQQLLRTHLNERLLHYMTDLPSKRYGWRHAFGTLFSRIFPASWYGARECEKNHAPHCSEAVCRAYRNAIGLDLVPEKPDWRTTPGDIAKSIHIHFIGPFDLTEE